MTSTIDAMTIRFPIALLLAALLTAACSRGTKDADPTGLKAGMTKAQVTDILGEPTTIKPAGKDREIYIYREPTEMIHVFLIEGRIKNIEHVRRKPPTISR